MPNPGPNEIERRSAARRADAAAMEHRAVRRIAGVWREALTAATLGLLLGVAPLSADAASTTTELTSTPNPSSFGSAVEFTAEVTALGGGAPTGSVSFRDGTSSIGSGGLDAIGVGHSLSAGAHFTCVLTTAGGVQCWGRNDYGQLGDGTFDNRSTPVDVSGLGSGVRAVSVGEYHACALTIGGNVKCWGDNWFFQLGTTLINRSNTPIDVTALGNNIQAISTGSYHTCASTNGGGLKCWGRNGSGQLGNGTTTESADPVDVVGLGSGVAAISAGDGWSTCARTEGGAAKCWGYNNQGQLGDGTVEDRSTPVDVTGLGAGVDAISTAYYHACVLTSARGVMCWGGNGLGQLGDGTTTERRTPGGVTDLAAGVAAISAGDFYTCALTDAGGVRCWGDNYAGKLGDGSTTNRTSPVDVVGLGSGIVEISAGTDHVCALTSAAAVMCWGMNDAGQLGDGTTTDRHTPVAVVGLSTRVVSRARLTTTALDGGARSITASYGGDGGHDGSVSSALTQVVTPVASTTGLVSSKTPSVFGESVTFTATVTSGVGTPSGSVGFFADATSLGSAPLAAGTASLATSSLAVGDHAVTAVYGGDGGHDGSSASAVTQTVAKGATTATLGASAAAITLGDTVSFTATVAVSSPAAGAPSGSVGFSDGGTSLGTRSVSGGTATLATAALTAGTHTVTATYDGDGNFTGATTDPVTVTVALPVYATTTTLTATPNPVKTGKFVTLTATVTSPGGTPTGTVGFVDGSVGLATATLTSGSATFVSDALTSGVHGLTASYAGVTADEKVLQPSVSTPMNLTVDPREGSEFRVNTTTAGSQQLPDVAPLAGGGFVVVWSSDRQGGSGSVIHAQRYTAKGAAMKGQFRVDTAGADRRTTPRVAGLGGGGFVVVWQNRGAADQARGIFGRRFNAAGVAIGSEFRIDAADGSAQEAPSVAASDDGGFTVVWAYRARRTTTASVYARRFDAAGKGGTEFIVATNAVAGLYQPRVAGLGARGFVVVWRSPRAGGTASDIRAQRFTATGVRRGIEIPVTSSVT